MKKSKKAGAKASVAQKSIAVAWKFGDGSTASLPLDSVMKVRERQMRALGVLDGKQAAAEHAKQAAAEHGKKGGAPPSPWVPDWAELVASELKRNPRLTKTAAYKKVAQTWRDDTGRARSWTTIRDGLSRKRDGGKPPFSR